MESERVMAVRRVLGESAPTLAAKFDALLQGLGELGSACIGYSGGVDSVLLAQAAVLALDPARVLAVTGVSASVSAAQRSAARECARRIGVRHLEVATDELANPAYAANPANRCYFCKSELWSRLRRVADEHGLVWLLEGSNADDVREHRPGLRAAREQQVRAPLLEAGLTKSEIRELSRAFELPTWDQPAAPCLASRLPQGLAVTPERLRQVEAAEAALHALGFSELRVRHHGDAARIELGAAELAAASRLLAAVTRGVQAAGFTRVLLDVEGYRRGALQTGLTRLQPARA
jgi:uncharacterized protein